MSGSAVIICSYAQIYLLHLYSKSPKALDKFKLPFTLPIETVPPALWILSNYFVSYGLWSKDKGFVCLLTDATALESPAFAQ